MVELEFHLKAVKFQNPVLNHFVVLLPSVQKCFSVSRQADECVVNELGSYSLFKESVFHYIYILNLYRPQFHRKRRP